jgi:hypothetical protein
VKFSRFFLAIVFAAVPLCGQEGITVTASRTADLSPEEVTWNIAVLADQDSTLDQVLQAIKDTGLAAKDLTGISAQQYGPGPSQSRLAYQFAITARFASFKETMDKLAAARRSLLANNSNIELQTYFMSVAASEASREQARQAALADLIADARRKAELAAKAAGLTLGSIQGMIDSTSAVLGVAGPYTPYGPAGLKTVFQVTVRFGVQ